MKMNSGNVRFTWRTGRLLRLLTVFITLLLVPKPGQAWLGQNDDTLIRDMELVHKINSHAVKLNLDEVVLQHIPLGTQANVALDVCQRNGFKTYSKNINNDTKGLDFSGFDEYLYCTKTEMRWFLIGSDEYRAVIYFKNNRVGAVIGRYFFHTL